MIARGLVGPQGEHRGGSRCVDACHEQSAPDGSQTRRRHDVPDLRKAGDVASPAFRWAQMSSGRFGFACGEPEFLPDAVLDALEYVGIVLEELLGVFAPLPETLAAVGEPRP